MIQHSALFEGEDMKSSPSLPARFISSSFFMYSFGRMRLYVHDIRLYQLFFFVWRKVIYVEVLIRYIRISDSKDFCRSAWCWFEAILPHPVDLTQIHHRPDDARQRSQNPKNLHRLHQALGRWNCRWDRRNRQRNKRRSILSVKDYPMNLNEWKYCDSPSQLLNRQIFMNFFSPSVVLIL